jgi:Spy/CpxP family protein refolding chaperone
MTKNVLLKVALAAALAAPVIYGLSSTGPDAPPELGRGPRVEGPRAEAPRFRQGAPEGLDAYTERLRGERPVVAAREGRGPRDGRGVRGERGPRGDRGERGPLVRGERGARFVDHLSTELSLTPEQSERVKAVFERQRSQRGDLRGLAREERQAARETRRAQIEAELAEILTPEQQSRMTELRAERQARAEAGGRRARSGQQQRYQGGVDTRGI